VRTEIPTRVYSPAVRHAREESASEAASWFLSSGGTGELEVYRDAGRLPAGYAIGIRRPGKYASPNRSTPIPYDMLPVVWTPKGKVGFDAGFNDICRSLWNLGQGTNQQQSESSARLFGALLYRNACFADHAKTAGRWRYSPAADAIADLGRLPATRVETLTATLDLPPSVFLFLLEIIALIEDTKYWELGGKRIKGRTGRPNTLMTCARALASGLGDEHPMDFAYSLMRGRGVASLTRDRARDYFG
jgi:hypothetical protein